MDVTKIWPNKLANSDETRIDIWKILTSFSLTLHI